MCTLLKLDYAKFGVSKFFSKVFEEKPFGVNQSPLEKDVGTKRLGKGRVKGSQQEAQNLDYHTL